MSDGFEVITTESAEITENNHIFSECSVVH